MERGAGYSPAKVTAFIIALILIVVAMGNPDGWIADVVIWAFAILLLVLAAVYFLSWLFGTISRALRR